MELPLDCSQREKLKIQPIYNPYSRLKKCCPIGESLNLFKENQSEVLCDTTTLNFVPEIINAVLYDNCIEDIETEVFLPLQIGNPCNTSFLYNNADDIFYVLQDGSLLIMDAFANDSYSVEQNYCMDVDNVSGTTYAIICITSVEEHLQRSQVMTVAILMLISIPCLFLVSYLHMSLKQLRTIHGVTLSMMAASLAAGQFLYAVAHIYDIRSKYIGYIVQFFLLAYFFWFLCLCSNVLLNIWYKIPRNKRFTKLIGHLNFGLYCLVSFSGPLILVILTIQKGLLGMPSYFIQGFTESIRDSQRYFIPPVSTVLVLCFLLMVASFFGFQKIKRENVSRQKDSNVYTGVNSDFDKEKYEEVKKDAKCMSLLLFIMITTWLLEIVTFYSPGPQNYLVLMEMVNGVQGILILLIFLVVRRRRTIILRWWYDRGSHNLEDNNAENNARNNNIELTAINK